MSSDTLHEEMRSGGRAVKLECVINHNVNGSMSKRRLVCGVIGSSRSLLPANRRSARTLAHTHNGVHARLSQALPRERIAASALRPLEGDDDKEEKTIKTTKEKGEQ